MQNFKPESHEALLAFTVWECSEPTSYDSHSKSCPFWLSPTAFRIIKLLSCFLLSFCWTVVHAEPKYPVDISYMVCDFKYSQEHGLKICEVQHGALSALGGDLYISGKVGSISPMIANFFDHFPMKKWASGPSYTPLRRSLVAKGWKLEQSIKRFPRILNFWSVQRCAPADPSSIASYAGIVYASRELAKDFDFYRNAYPGILFVDAATLPYWIDKYKMNLLFNDNAELKEYKADWEPYPKKYDPSVGRKDTRKNAFRALCDQTKKGIFGKWRDRRRK